MAKKKQQYMIIKLAPNVSAWNDMANNIFLSKGRRTEQRLKDNCDMKMINKGVKAGLIILKQCEEEIEVKEVKEVKSRKSQKNIAPVMPDNITPVIPDIPKEEKKVEEVKDNKNEVKVEVSIIKGKEE